MSIPDFFLSVDIRHVCTIYGIRTSMYLLLSSEINSLEIEYTTDDLVFQEEYAR